MGRLKAAAPRLSAAKPRLVPAPKVRAPIYADSGEYRGWREEVMRLSGHRCRLCGRRNGRLFADHIVEIKDGGAPYDPANGQALCGSCHTKKTVKERNKRMRLNA